MISYLTFIAYFSLAVIIYIYVGYPVLLTLLSLLFPAPKVKKEKIRPAVSLIISCYNEEDILPRKLANSLAIDYPKDTLEIIVVSDASSDRTDEIAREHAEQGVRLIRQEKRLGKTMGLNMAVPRARGEIIVFSDANAMYSPDAIIRLVENFADSTVGYVVGEAKYIDTDKTAAARSEDTYWQYEIFMKKMESRLHSLVGGDGAIYAIRKDLYEELKDTDINDFVNPLQIIAKGYRGIYEPTAVCEEQTASSFAKEFKRKIRIVNRAFSGLLRIKGVMNPFKTGIFSFKIISHKLLRWFAPFFLLAFTFAALILAFYGIRPFQTFSALAVGVLLFSLPGWFTSNNETKIWPVFYFPYYFMSVNIASIIGIIRSLKGDVQVTWETVRSREQRKSYRHKSVHFLFFSGLAILSGFFLAARLTQPPIPADQVMFWVMLMVICYVYFGYPAVLYFWSRFHSRPVLRKEITPDVTLLICAYNEEEVIEQKIKNSFGIDYPQDKLKIAIASDGSYDRTNEIIKKYISNQLILFDYQERRGKISAIITTIPQLDTEIIVFSDANTMYAPDAIKKLVRNFHDPSVGAVSSNVILQNDETSFGKSESVYYAYERWIQQKESEIGSIIGADGGMYAIRRDLFIAPSPNIILDDFVISMNVALQGYRLIYDGEATAYEKSRIPHQAEFSRKSRVISGGIQSIKQCEGVPALNQASLLFCYLSHKFLRWMVPTLLVLLFLTNAYLASGTEVKYYKLAMAAQGLFYIAAALGYAVRKLISVPLLAIPCYFCLENGAALYGIYKGLFNKQAVTWKKFAR